MAGTGHILNVPTLIVTCTTVRGSLFYVQTGNWSDTFLDTQYYDKAAPDEA